MAGNILESITAQYHSLTRSGKKLADYIFAHTCEAQYFSISTLAENSGVSEASITRFCHGLAGYNDFKLALAKTDRVTDLGELSDSPQSIASEDSLSTIFQKIHDASVLSLNETLALLDETAISKAVDLLVKSKKVALGMEEAWSWLWKPGRVFPLLPPVLSRLQIPICRLWLLLFPLKMMRFCFFPIPVLPRIWRILCRLPKIGEFPLF